MFVINTETKSKVFLIFSYLIGLFGLFSILMKYPFVLPVAGTAGTLVAALLVKSDNETIKILKIISIIVNAFMLLAGLLIIILTFYTFILLVTSS